MFFVTLVEVYPEFPENLGDINITCKGFFSTFAKAEESMQIYAEDMVNEKFESYIVIEQIVEGVPVPVNKVWYRYRGGQDAEFQTCNEPGCWRALNFDTAALSNF